MILKHIIFFYALKMVDKGSKAHLLLPAQTRGVLQDLEALFPQ